MTSLSLPPHTPTPAALEDSLISHLLSMDAHPINIPLWYEMSSGIFSFGPSFLRSCLEHVLTGERVLIAFPRGWEVLRIGGE